MTRHRARTTRPLDRILRDTRKHAEEIAERIFLATRDVAGYRSAPREVFVPAAQGQLERFLDRALGEWTGATPAKVARVASAGMSMRAEYGVELVSALRAFQIMHAEVWSEVLASAERLRLPPGSLVEATRRLFEAYRLLTASLVDAYQARDRQASWMLEQTRASFIHALIAGTLAPAELAESCERMNLSASQAYLPFVASADDERALRDLVQRVRSGGGVIVLADSRAAGVQPAGRPVATSATVGLGPAAPLGSITRPFAAARRAHDTAAALALRGNHTIVDLGLLPAVFADRDVGAAIAARYGQPLANLGSFGAILRDTVEAYFAEGMRLDLTARRLAVHQNTLLHRLRRFEEATGADLRRVGTVAEVWWALQQQRMGIVDSGAEGSR